MEIEDARIAYTEFLKRSILNGPFQLQNSVTGQYRTRDRDELRAIQSNSIHYQKYLHPLTDPLAYNRRIVSPEIYSHKVLYG